MALSRVPGVEKAAVSYGAGKATVAYDPATVTPQEFMDELERMTGYTSEIIDDPGLSLSDTDEHADAETHDHDDPDHDHESMDMKDTTRTRTEIECDR